MSKSIKHQLAQTSSKNAEHKSITTQRRDARANVFAMQQLNNSDSVQTPKVLQPQNSAPCEKNPDDICAKTVTTVVCV